MIRWLKVENIGVKYKLTVGVETDRVIVLHFDDMEFRAMQNLINNLEDVREGYPADDIALEWVPPKWSLK